MLSNPRFDADLLGRYDRPGPRYTSYPTAPQFSMDFDERALREAARESNGDPIPRLLSIYVHVPFWRFLQQSRERSCRSSPEAPVGSGAEESTSRNRRLSVALPARGASSTPASSASATTVELALRYFLN
jgi:hypothetical protein